jgi:hypothetical protein
MVHIPAQKSDASLTGRPDQLVWVKSRRSGPSGNCVEIAHLPDGRRLAVRNSRHPDGPLLIFARDDLRGLIDGAKSGDYDQFLS